MYACINISNMYFFGLILFAAILPDALQTLCAKCNDKHKEVALKVASRLEKDYPKEWKQLRDKWDPTGEHYVRFQDFIEQEKKKRQNKLVPK